MHFLTKTATLPSIRVAPEFRATVESVLLETETLTEFVARGIQSLEAAKQTDNYIDAGAVIVKLSARLAIAKERASNNKKKKRRTGSG